MGANAPPARGGLIRRSLSQSRVLRVISVATVMSLLAASVRLAPVAVADSADSLRAALTHVREGTSCKPLRSDPIVERGAAIVTRSSHRWIDFTGRAKPYDIPLPVIAILRDLGYKGTKAKQIQGGAPTDAEAIKATLLEGFSTIQGDAAILNCTYTDYGVSVEPDERTGNVLVAAVLAGP